MPRYEAFSLPEFNGLDEDENPHALRPGDLRVAQNTWRIGRSLGTRPGTVRDPDGLYDAAMAGSPTVCGIADFRRARDTARNLVVVVPDAIHTSDTAVVALGASGVVVTNAAELPWTFAQHRNKLYAAGGDLTTDTAWSWDGVAANPTLLTIPNLSSVAVHPRYIFQWHNRLWASGFNDSDLSANPGIVRYSALNDGAVWPADNSFGGNFSVGGFAADAEEYLTGFGSYADNRGAWLLALSNRRIYGLQETGSVEVVRLTEEIALGCVGQSAFVNLGVDAGDALFMSDWGIHSLRQTLEHGGREDRFLSWPIRQTFESINRGRMNQVVSAYWSKYGYALWAVPTGSSIVNDTILALDLRDLPAGSLSSESARWHVWNLSGSGHLASALVHGRTVDRKSQVFLGTYDGNVCVFSDTRFDDLGLAYTTKASTKYSTLNAPTRTKILGDVYVDLGPGGDYHPTFKATFDFGREEHETVQLEMPTSAAVWDSAVWDVDEWAAPATVYRNKVYTTGRGDVVSFTFEHAAANEPFYVHGVFTEAAVMGEGVES